MPTFLSFSHHKEESLKGSDGKAGVGVLDLFFLLSKAIANVGVQLFLVIRTPLVVAGITSSVASCW